MINISATVDRLREIMDDDSNVQLKEELNSFHSADLADIFQELKAEERLECFSLIEEDKAADMIEYLPPNLQVEILGDIDTELAARIIQKLPHDAAADVLGDMEDDDTEAYLDSLPQKFSDEVRELMNYDEDTAGGMMTPLFMTVTSDMTVKEVLDYVRDRADEDNIDLYYVYVTDKQEHLLGVVSLKSLLRSSLKTKIEDLMNSDIVKLHIDDYRDAVLDVFMKYQFDSLPVVDQYNHLRGVVTWDDIQDAAEEETTEEIYASSGIATGSIDEDEILEGSIFTSIRARTPWLFVTLIGELIAVNVANCYGKTLQALPVIAIFMPLLAGLAGNIGTQSITIIVRGLSTGQVTLGSTLKHIFRESAIGFLIGAFFGALVMLFTWGWQNSIELGLIVGLAMAINMSLATLIGTLTPFAMEKMNIDPAVASGPVIATAIDVLGLAVYFSLATIYLIKIM
ncbi:magnesium transporter [bacterium]|nr:magnesium transporter [bacterium]